MNGVDRSPLMGFIDRCQVVICQHEHDHSTTFLHLADLAKHVPSGLSPAHEVVVSCIFSQIVVRVARAAGLAEQPVVSAALRRLHAAQATLGQWQPALIGAIEACARASLPMRRIELDELPTAAARSLSGRRPRLVDVALATGRSLSRISREYTRRVGVPFLQHVQTQRIETAQRLLSATSLTMKEVADKAGYPDASSFSRHFRLATGMTPSTFRRRHMESASHQLDS